MPGITGMGTTFDLPNFVGDLFDISPEATPLLSAIGGLTGGKPANDTQFEWQFYDLRDADITRQRVEGDDAQTPTARVRQNASNVVEIHQETVSVSYTRMGTSPNGSFATTQRGPSVVQDEYRWQVDTQLKQIARDVNQAFISGTYAKPSDNTTPRKTRGLLQAIATNVKDMAGGTPDVDDILDLFQTMFQNGGFQEGETRTVICGLAMKRHLGNLFITTPGLQPLSRNIGGVNLIGFQTDIGPVAIMLDEAVPTGQLVAVSLEDLAPRFLEIPGKGHFFLDPLGTTGAYQAGQLYGEIGLEYGNERKHAKLVDATTPYDAVGVGSGS